MRLSCKLRLTKLICQQLTLRVGMQLKELRREIDRLLLKKLEDPGYDLGSSKAVAALHQLLATDGF